MQFLPNRRNAISEVRRRSRSQFDPLLINPLALVVIEEDDIPAINAPLAVVPVEDAVDVFEEADVVDNLDWGDLVLAVSPVVLPSQDV
ncbi:hypothetical protein AMTR_s00021p00160590 [Amborella trichopoda]|uniref:Uncharacterized protein n=1 Tax=Amborella trichopoda TaxID=13333 RepID=W1Q103_AMBTC|nr:hypothetical protein AMTR_s00021p00160590 [Amborella trichopoda]